MKKNVVENSLVGKWLVGHPQWAIKIETDVLSGRTNIIRTLTAKEITKYKSTEEDWKAMETGEIDPETGKPMYDQKKVYEFICKAEREEVEELKATQPYVELVGGTRKTAHKTFKEHYLVDGSGIYRRFYYYNYPKYIMKLKKVNAIVQSGGTVLEVE